MSPHPANRTSEQERAKAVAHLRPLLGGERIARAYAEIARRSGDRTTFVERTVNGLPGLVAYQDGTVATVFAFEIAGDRIRHIRAVHSPERLRPRRAGEPGRTDGSADSESAAGRETGR